MNNSEKITNDPSLIDYFSQEHPSPLIVELAERGDINGNVLDINCGTGNDALYLSALGYSSLGIDDSIDDLKVAKQTAELMLVRRGTCARFKPGNPLHLDRLNEKFNTILDQHDFLRFSPEEQKEYAESITKVTQPGGVILIVVRPKGIYTTNTSIENYLIKLFGSNWIAIRNECYPSKDGDFMYIMLQNGQGS